MPYFYESEKREFVRVGVAVPVEYRFIALESQIEVPGGMLKGGTRNLGAGGILMAGAVPDPELISHLLMQKAGFVVRIHLPDEGEPVQAIARVAWIEAVTPHDKTCSFGLCFREITTEAQNALLRFVIDTQMA